MGYIFKALVPLLVICLFTMIVMGFFTGLFSGWVGITTGIFLATITGIMSFLTSYGLFCELRSLPKNRKGEESDST